MLSVSGSRLPVSLAISYLSTDSKPYSTDPSALTS